jgi:hypothetical protein
MTAQKKSPIGAKVTIAWKNGGSEEVYFSFSEEPIFDQCCSETEIYDDFGVLDNFIFYYAEMGEYELNNCEFNDWIITGYVLIYDKEYI